MDYGLFSVTFLMDGLHFLCTIAPRCELDEWILYYWHLGFSDTKVADHALDPFDRKLYGLRYLFWHCFHKSNTVINVKSTIQL